MSGTSERLKTGVPGLDQMLRGGFLRGDAVLLAGCAGTGKTTLAMQYLVQGASDGEGGIYLTFEELPDQLYRDAMKFGWDLKKLEAEGKLRVICTSPDVLAAPEGMQAILDGPLAEINARRIVVDSLSHYQMFVRPDALRLQVYRTIMYFKAKNLSSMLIWESLQSAGSSFTVSDEGISFLTDSIVILKLIEIVSSLRKGMVEMKMRGSEHDKKLREFEITSSGLKVEAQFENYEGLMTGAPTKTSAEKFAELFSKSSRHK